MGEKNFIPLSRNLLNDPKVKALQACYGKAEGVGHWAILLLELYGANTPTLELNSKWIELAICDDHGIAPEELDFLCGVCAEVGLIDPLLWKDSRQVCNAHVNDQKAAWRDAQEQRSNAGKKSGEARRKKNGTSE